ncbi:MAG: DUF58 domain-containing protein [Myxococcales bacterium]|nr:DUF58 domain-containing protein [Myxococcales bacterium]
MNFARLNHILIPSTSAERERWRRTILGRMSAPGWWIYGALSEEGRALSVLVLFIGTAGLDVSSTQVYVLWALLIGLLVGSMAVRGWLALDGVRAVVHVAPRVSVDTLTTFEVELSSESTKDHQGIRIRGPFLPWDGTWLDSQQRVADLPAGERARRELTARFVQRGRHHLDPFRAAALVPFGLAVGPSIATETCHFMVVPKIAHVESLTLPLQSRERPGGKLEAARSGETMDLLGVRPYRRGDPIRDLHPKTWARRGTPHVREYQQEHFSRTVVLVDDERAGSEAAFEALISLAAGVVAQATRGNAIVELVLASEAESHVVVDRSGAAFDRALDVLAEVGTDAKHGGADILERLAPRLGDVSGLVFVTGSASDDRRALVEAIRQRGVACLSLRVADDLLPAWLARLTRPREEASLAIGGEKVVAASDVTAGRALRL